MMGGPVGIADGRLLNAFHEAAMTHPTERTTHGTHDHIL
jgi:hypothetical protein